MKEKIISYNSSWGVILENQFIDQDSSILTVILPDEHYRNCSPLIYYSYKTALSIGSDVLLVDYGFQMIKSDFGMEMDLSIMFKESKEILQNCLKKEYRRVIFIGKGLGTIIQNKLSEEFIDYEQTHIYLSPVNIGLESIVNEAGLVIMGMEDRNISKENIRKIEGMNNITLIKLNNANSELETTDTLKGIKLLAKVFELLTDFLKENLKNIL